MNFSCTDIFGKLTNCSDVVNLKEFSFKQYIEGKRKRAEIAW